MFEFFPAGSWEPTPRDTCVISTWLYHGHIWNRPTSSNKDTSHISKENEDCSYPLHNNLNNCIAITKYKSIAVQYFLPLMRTSWFWWLKDLCGPCTDVMATVTLSGMQIKEQMRINNRLSWHGAYYVPFCCKFLIPTQLCKYLVLMNFLLMW